MTSEACLPSRVRQRTRSCEVEIRDLKSKVCSVAQSGADEIFLLFLFGKTFYLEIHFSFSRPQEIK